MANFFVDIFAWVTSDPSQSSLPSWPLSQFRPQHLFSTLLAWFPISCSAFANQLGLQLQT